MSDEPERLTDETRDPLERALLHEARAGGASEHTRARTLAALGLPNAPIAQPPHGIGLKVGLAIVGALGVGALAWLALHGPEQAPIGASTMPPSTVERPTPIVTGLALPNLGAATTALPPTIVDVVAPSASVAVLASAAPKPRLAPTVKGNAPAYTLADEVRLIDQARKALYDHDKEGSLGALDEYDRRFPSSGPRHMGPEAQGLRDRALRLP
ncbi:hypothetical protein BH09MYX1_BH09MYX1_56710 [soil metagenome]